MLDVLVNVARSADVLHQVHAVWLQRSANALEDVERPRLVVDRIKGRDEVEGFGLRSLVEVTQIARDELDVVATRSRRVFSRVRDRTLRMIHSDESALGIECREPVQDERPTASYVKHADAR
jgi:hypothetical protein